MLSYFFKTKKFIISLLFDLIDPGVKFYDRQLISLGWDLYVYDSASAVLLNIGLMCISRLQILPETIKLFRFHESVGCCQKKLNFLGFMDLGFRLYQNICLWVSNTIYNQVSGV